MGIFDGVTGGQGGLTKEDAAYQQQLRRVDAERQKYEYEIEKAKYEIEKAKYEIEKAKYNQGLGGVRPKQQQAVPRFNPNESEAFQIPMSQLVTMWRLKHGEEWVDMQRARPPSGKDFYTDALDRLDRASKLELFDGWCRLKEDA
jgi:hypothetical protein